MNYLWTQSFARLHLIRATDGKNLHWLFLPGGPGLGSEALLPLVQLLKLPGSMWLCDLPGDGSNHEGSFNKWSEGLLEATGALKNVILVAHSRGGMFALATPHLEKNLKGLVLMGTSPNQRWLNDLELKIADFPLPEADAALEAYKRNPSNAALRESVITAAPRMFFTEEALRKGKEFMQELPFNYEAWEWAESNFDPTYEAKWKPKIPTLILAGEKDIALPIEYFEDYKGPNFLKREIRNAGHFPWMENPKEVVRVFQEFQEKLS